MTGMLGRLFSLSVIITAVMAGGVMPPASAQTAPTSDYFLNRAINNLTNDDFESADKHFQAARDAQGDTAEINLRIAELYIEYASEGQSKSLPYLKVALAKDPTLNRTRLVMGQVYFHLEAYSDAISSLTPLLGDTEYGGYSRYYLGVIDYRQRRFDMARLRMEDIVADGDAGLLRESAESYLEAIAVTQKPWSAYGIATLRYDSNPQIVSDDAVNASELNAEQREDYALIFQGQGSYTFLQHETHEVKIRYQLFDIQYDHLARLEQQGHILSLDATYFGDRVTTDVAYAFEYWTVDSEKFRRTQRLSTSLTGKLTPSSETKLGYQLSYVDRYDDSTRNGPRHRASIHHVLDFSGDWRAGIGYAFQLEDTDQVHESENNELTVELHAPQFHRLDIQLQGSYNRTRFPDAGSSEHRDKEDNRALTLAISRRLSDHYHLRLGARKESNRSDAPSFTYDRFYLDVGLLASF